MNHKEIDKMSLSEISKIYPRIIRLKSGRYIDLVNPNPDDIIIEDIVHALTNIPRFTGHLNTFYSVAQHSVLTAKLVDDEHKFAALMHDASEAYLGDISSPLKNLIPDYKDIESNMMRIIANKFGFQYPLHQAVKDADYKMLEHEWHSLVLGDKEYKYIKPWNHKKAKGVFLKHFKNFSSQNNK